jgi:hypothetical protein
LALRALSLSPDARVERARVCELLADVRAEERPFVLVSVHQILADAPPLHEALSPGADAICSTQLETLLEDEQLGPGERDLVVSALETLEAPKSSP